MTMLGQTIKQHADRPADPSRKGEGSAIARPHHPRLKYPLSASQLKEYHEKGYVILRGVFTAEEMRAFQEEADRLYRRLDLARPGNMRFGLATNPQTNEKVIWKIDPFRDLSELFERMTRDRRIRDPLASIYEGREPRLFKDKFIYKPPHTKGNALHQDYTWWQGFPESLISVMIAVDGANETNGCTQLLPGYHQQGYMSEVGTFTPLREDQVDLSRAEKVVTEPGDVALFGCFTPHLAGPNQSDRTRRQIFLTYNDSRDGEHYEAHYEHFLWYATMEMEEAKRQQMYLQ